MDQLNSFIRNLKLKIGYFSADQGRLAEPLRSKKALAAAGIVIAAVILFFNFFTASPVRESANKRPDMPSSAGSVKTPLTAASPTPFPFTPLQLKTIEEQRRSDEAVGKREIEIRTNYPWFIKLPLRAQNYFVYFDLEKKVFVGLLYPQAADNLDQMKAEIMQKLKTVYGVPTDNYAFDWRVSAE